MILTIDTDHPGDIAAVAHALNLQPILKPRFFRGLPPPYGNGVEITDQMLFESDGTPIFSESAS